MPMVGATTSLFCLRSGRAAKWMSMMSEEYVPSDVSKRHRCVAFFSYVCRKVPTSYVARRRAAAARERGRQGGGRLDTDPIGS